MTFWRAVSVIVLTFTLIGHLDTFVAASKWANWIVKHWSDLVWFAWRTILWFVPRLGPNDASLLTATTTLLGSALKSASRSSWQRSALVYISWFTGATLILCIILRLSIQKLEATIRAGHPDYTLQAVDIIVQYIEYLALIGISPEFIFNMAMFILFTPILLLLPAIERLGGVHINLREMNIHIWSTLIMVASVLVLSHVSAFIETRLPTLP
jgi:hypothetical protein